MNTHELAWAAGFLEGEGCWYTRRHLTKGQEYPAITASQVDRGVLDRLQAALGLGKVYGPYVKRTNGKATKPQFEWAMSGFEKVQAATALVWGFLGHVKREQAVKVLQRERK